MIRSLNSFFVSISRRWWAVVLVVVLNFASFQILFGLEDQFEALTGLPVFDTQNNLTATRLLEQLPRYDGAAREAYLRFAAFDFVFPLIAGVFVVTMWTLLLRTNSSPFAQGLLQRGVAMFGLTGTIWDWFENISILTILQVTAPQEWMVQAVLVFKRLKLLWLFLNGPITVALMVLWATDLVKRYRLKLQTNRKLEDTK